MIKRKLKFVKKLRKLNKMLAEAERNLNVATVCELMEEKYELLENYYGGFKL